MKERPRGPLGRATGLAEGVAAAMRRAQREREPRVLLYGSDGQGRLLHLDARGYDRVIDAAERLVEAVAGFERADRRGPAAADGDEPREPAA